MGALERINRAGITKLAAIHRGFFSFEKTGYRNAPNWQIAIELKLAIPNLPMLCDPSHIAGTRALIEPLSQKAFDLNMDGLMVEVHVDPSQALSDKEQQLTPIAFREILSKLVVRACEPSSICLNELQMLRSKIDKIDSSLLHSLAERIDTIHEIGAYKKENNITIFQLERWKEILATRSAIGEELGLDRNFIKKLLQLMHKESIRIQTEEMNPPS
jgi:chorismate mutase